MKHIKIRVDVSINELTKISKHQAACLISGVDDNKGTFIKHLDSPTTGICSIEYPLTKIKKVVVDNAEWIGEILWDLAQEYKEIYETQYEKHGVWGHTIDNLYFEGVEIFKDGQIKIQVGS